MAGISIAIDAVTANIIAVFLFIVYNSANDEYVVKKWPLVYLHAS